MLSVAMMFSPSCGVQRTILPHNILFAHLLRRSVLYVTHFDKGEQPVQMPFLTLEWYLMNNHPVIYQLGRYYLLITFWGARRRIMVYRCRRHRVCDVITYFLYLVVSKSIINVLVNAVHGHALNIIEHFLGRFLIFFCPAEEGLMVFRLPF